MHCLQQQTRVTFSFKPLTVKTHHIMRMQNGVH